MKGANPRGGANEHASSETDKKQKGGKGRATRLKFTDATGDAASSSSDSHGTNSAPLPGHAASHGAPGHNHSAPLPAYPQIPSASFPPPAGRGVFFLSQGLDEPTKAPSAPKRKTGQHNKKHQTAEHHNAKAVPVSASAPELVRSAGSGLREDPATVGSISTVSSSPSVSLGIHGLGAAGTEIDVTVASRSGAVGVIGRGLPATSSEAVPGIIGRGVSSIEPPRADGLRVIGRSASSLDSSRADPVGVIGRSGLDPSRSEAVGVIGRGEGVRSEAVGVIGRGPGADASRNTAARAHHNPWVSPETPALWATTPADQPAPYVGSSLFSLPFFDSTPLWTGQPFGLQPAPLAPPLASPPFPPASPLQPEIPSFFDDPPLSDDMYESLEPEGPETVTPSTFPSDRTNVSPTQSRFSGQSPFSLWM